MMDKERLNSLIAAKFEKTGTWRRRGFLNESRMVVTEPGCQFGRGWSARSGLGRRH
jgi:hypothetical protein